MSHYDKLTDFLDNLITCSAAEAARRCGISPRLPWTWQVESKLGHPKLQAVIFCNVTAPFHVHWQNAKSIMGLQIEQSAIERARDGVWVDTYFQGQRTFERRLKPEFEGKSDDDLMFEVGPEWEKECYETRPVKTWMKPSDMIVLKMLEAFNRRRYGSHQQIDVTYGGVLRLERPEEQTKVIEHRPEVFEENTEDDGEGGHHLALARPAKDSAELDRWNDQGEFSPAPVTFVNAKGDRTELRADIEDLRAQAAELKRNGPVHPRPEGRVEVFKPTDEPRTEPQKPEPIPQGIEDHPRAYSVPKPQAPRKVAPYTGGTLGDGREGIGPGPDPRRDERGGIGFPVSGR